MGFNCMKATEPLRGNSLLFAIHIPHTFYHAYVKVLFYFLPFTHFLPCIRERIYEVKFLAMNLTSYQKKFSQP